MRTATLAFVLILPLIAIACQAPPAERPRHAVGGAVSGLPEGKSLELANGVEAVTVGNGAFTFTSRIAEGNTYTVSVTSAPRDVRCVVSGGTGTVRDEDVASISVTCTEVPLHTLGGERAHGRTTAAD